LPFKLDRVPIVQCIISLLPNGCYIAVYKKHNHKLHAYDSLLNYICSTTPIYIIGVIKKCVSLFYKKYANKL